jgi:asparagine synthase (glutamine-hydrolysing)
VAYDLTDPFQIGAYAALSTYAPQFRVQVTNSHLAPEDFFRGQLGGTRVDIQILALLCRGYLLENGLAQGDRLSMANSVELRLPLVDYKLAEILVGIQKHTPAYIDKPKNLLVNAARGLVPDYIVNKPKLGFNPPMASWIATLRNDLGRELMQGALVQEDMLDGLAAKRLVDGTWRFGANYDMFQKYLVLEFWFRGMQAVARNAGIEARGSI